MRIFLSALLLFCLQSATAATLTFDDFETAGSSSIFSFVPIDIGEFRLTPTDAPAGSGSNALAFFGQNSPFYSGSAAVHGVNGSNIVLSRIDGLAFSVSALDFDQPFGAAGTPLELIGNLSGGGSLLQTFVYNLASGYESILLSGFDSITSLQFGAVGPNNANLFNIDNIELSAPVPLPAAAWLFITAIGSIVCCRRRNKFSN